MVVRRWVRRGVERGGGQGCLRLEGLLVVPWWAEAMGRDRGGSDDDGTSETLCRESGAREDGVFLLRSRSRRCGAMLVALSDHLGFQ